MGELLIILALPGSCKKYREIRVFCGDSDRKRYRIGPPIQVSALSLDVWVLFERYLSYGLKRVETFHPLGARMRGILVSGTDAIEVETLMLSVSVETLLTAHFSGVMPADSGTEKNIKIAKRVVFLFGLLVYAL